MEITLKVNDQILDKFMWFLQHFKSDEVEVIEKNKLSETDYLLSSPKNKDRLLTSLKKAREGKVFENTIKLISCRYHY